jgi:tetratricopeptide (TPR) repeat protein
MKTPEKILIALFVAFLIGILLLGYQFFILAQCVGLILSLCYLIGGYYFFNYKDDRHALNITAGIILGLALLLFNISLWIPVTDFRKGIVSINLIFLLGLLLWWIYKRAHFSTKMRHLVFRSFFIAALTSFLSFSSIQSDTYRYVLLQMSEPESYVYENISIFNDLEKSKEFTQKGDYESAITYAKSAIQHGKNWLDYDTSQYKSISGTYEKLAEIYMDYGDQYYNQKSYEEAIINYLKADSVFSHKDHVPAFAKATKSDIYWNRYNLLLAYDKIENYENYDTEMELLISNYSDVKDTLDIGYYNLAKSLAKNYAKRGIYKEALSINKSSLKILKPDSLNQLQEFENIYKRIVSNYLSIHQYSDSELYLNKYVSLAGYQDCFYLYTKALLLDRSNIDEGLDFAKKADACFSQESNPNNRFSSSLLLSNFQLKTSDFGNFEKQMAATKKLARDTNNPDYNDHLIDLTLGYYHQLIGNYKESLKYYEAALNYPESDPVFIGLRIAVLKTDLDIAYDKKFLTSQSLDYLNDFDNTPELASVQNMIAQINSDRDTRLSDSLYQVVIDTQHLYNTSYSGELGVAYNGLAVNSLARKDFKQADSLFDISMDVMDQYYGANRHINQLVTGLHIAESQWLQKNYEESYYALENVRETKKYCLGNTISIYDAYLLKIEGDLMFSNPSLQEKNYQQSLSIARNYLDDHHWFIKSLIGKLST